MSIPKIVFVVSILLSSLLVSAQKAWVGDLHAAQLEDFYSGKFTVITGFLELKKSSLEDLSLLVNLTSVGKYVYIFKNDMLLSLNGLENLISIGGKLSIIQNKELVNYCALSHSLLKDGIEGEKINEKIYDRFDTDDNEYDPSLNKLLEGDCKYTDPFEYLFF